MIGAMRFGVTLPNAGLGNDPTVLAELVAMVRSERGDEPFDFVLEAAWMYMYETPGRPDAIRRRIRKGPPRCDT